VGVPPAGAGDTATLLIGAPWRPVDIGVNGGGTTSIELLVAGGRPSATAVSV
jgi:hypothetical protein